MKKLKLGAVIAMLCISLVGCGEANSTNDSKKENSEAKVTIGFNRGSLCIAPIHIAYINGYFEEEFKAAGVEWEFEEIDLMQAAELLGAGKINACVGLTASLVKPVDNGLDIVFTTGIHTGCTKFYVKADSDIQSVADLKGKTIGVPGLSDSSTMNLKRKLADEGIGVSDSNMEVTFSEYGMTDLPIALDNGAVDAVALHDPVAYQAEEEYGFRRFLDTGTDEKFAGEYCCQAYVSAELAKEHPEAAAAYTRAVQKASAFIQANPEEAAKLQIEKEFCTGDLEINTSLLKSYNYSPSVSGGLETFKKCAEELKGFGDLKEDTNVNDFVTKHFIALDGVSDSILYNAASGQFQDK